MPSIAFTAQDFQDLATVATVAQNIKGRSGALAFVRFTTVAGAHSTFVTATASDSFIAAKITRAAVSSTDAVGTTVLLDAAGLTNAAKVIKSSKGEDITLSWGDADFGATLASGYNAVHVDTAEYTYPDVDGLFDNAHNGTPAASFAVAAARMVAVAKLAPFNSKTAINPMVIVPGAEMHAVLITDELELTRVLVMPVRL